ncbi:MAG: TonB-dependent receptor, partial [Bacteroidales bacterium]|nr:TonB-dependent receptor [Bacteroidales bacterium]
MKRLITLILFISAICVARVSAQNIEISGNLIEADTGEEVPFATVMLLNESDSTLLEYAISGSDGHFVFKNVKNRDYLLKISHITYTPYQKHIKKTDGKSLNLGNLKLSPIAEVLMEVVVHEAQAPLLFKGDTVEYNAATFKVAPGSTVEDLLKKLPGIEVDADGGIKSMGKDVSKVYVDGKNFFGDDPKMVTQNIDAEAVSKVQVYNDKS